MTISKELLSILVCPVSKQPVFVLSKKKLSQINKMLAAKELTTQSGEVIITPLEEALITRNGKMIYPVINGIPIMLEDNAIGVDSKAFFNNE